MTTTIYEVEHLHQPDGWLSPGYVEVGADGMIRSVSGTRPQGRAVETLRGFGVRVSLDDFGSGMSSFTYLKNLPVDCLKIDGQFMRQLGSDAYDQATVRAICAVAHATGKQTVAEGIETEEVAAMLRAFGVDYGQGFLWHAPAPLATLLEPSAAARLRGATSEAPTLRA